MSEKIQQIQRKLDDNQIWDRLHISGNYRMHACGRQYMLDAGLKLLDETLAQVESFSALSPKTKRELVMQKRNWGRDLSPEEEEEFGIE
ncbi:MAG: hypothetical protein UV55_C0030G0001 [Candidatus Gottesmanbacteria bacterium GW2011_GWC1_43_10]|nr:MAG: hypothetical protein UV55_C0030G0001 [Candidatus Gottesmanbacteria bacterium GW2011_GWC1_43_10]